MTKCSVDPKPLALVWALGLGAALAGCSSSDSEAPATGSTRSASTIVDVAADSGLTTLTAAATATGLADALAGPGPLTVFAPTDDAFAALNVDLSAVSTDIVANILLQHVIGRDVPSTEVVTSPTLTTLANLPLVVDASQDPILVGGAALGSTLDVLASNGRVHLMDAVIVPPTTLEVAAATPDFSTLVDAVGRASAAVQSALSPSTLTGGTAITVFAPTNAAIEAAGIDLTTISQDELDAVLSYHVVVGQALSTDLGDGQIIETLNGSLRVSIAGDQIQLIDEQNRTINVVAADLRTLSGAVHAIDQVLLPGTEEEPDLVDLATAAGLSTLVDLVGRVGLVDALRSPGPFTVFGPTDDAFAALNLDLSAVSDAVIANILLQHVIGRDVPSSEVLTSPTLTTLAGLPLVVDANPTPIVVGGAALSTTLDALASNGRAHIMDGVIVPPTILEVAASTADLSTLVTAVGRASSEVQAALAPSTLTGADPLTVFAPTNAAFAASGIDLDTISQEELDAVLKYHVVVGQALSTDLSNGQVIDTLNGQLRVHIDDDGIRLTDESNRTINVVATDIRTLTGVVHLIDQVLMPKPETALDLVGVATEAGLTTLVDLAVRAELADALRSPGPLTVFAPTNDAFAALNLDLSAVSDGIIANILLQHVIGRDVPSSEVVTSPTLTTLANLPLAIDAGQSPISVGGAALSATLDALASNGRAHVMDGVIVPPTTLEVAAATADLSKLVEAVQRASASISEALDPATLTGEAPITVFAPTNAAFALSGIDVSAADPADLDRILAYHVVAGQALSTDLSDGQVIETLNGNLTVSIADDGAISLIDAQGQKIRVTTTDIRTRSGVVHLIDRVLLPAPEVPDDLVALAVEGGLTTLVDLVTRASLVDALRGPGPLTVFAPTNAAFSELHVDLGRVSDDVIANILLQHVIGRDVPSSEVVTSPTLTTLANLPLVVDAHRTPITVGGAALSSTLDLLAGNGRAHLMDGVIVPPTILEVAAATSQFSTLVDAVQRSSATIQGALAPATLSGDAPITVFAPTNEAFARAGINLHEISQAELDRVLAYHVVAGQALSSDLSDGQVIETASGTLTVRISDGGIALIDAQGRTVNVEATDIRTLTGVVHQIDNVLLPAPSVPDDLVELATAGGLTQLVELAARVGLADALRGPGPLTVFGPTNAAFNALHVNFSHVSDDVIANILLQHVIGRDVPSSEVVTSPTLTTLANLPLVVDAQRTPITIGGAALSSTLDLLAGNGRAHVMDEVIVPPTIVAVAEQQLPTLFAALGAAHLVGAVSPNTLGGAHPITVFGPTDAAFEAIGISLDHPPRALPAILRYHVVPGQLLAADLTDGRVLHTAHGDTLTVDVDEEGRVFLLDTAGQRIRIQTTDIRTLTGAVHVIDGVLLPH